jgi:hypothetical protein
MQILFSTILLGKAVFFSGASLKDSRVKDIKESVFNTGD